MGLTLMPITDRTVRGKIFCANCLHCKLFRIYRTREKKQYIERVRCAAGKWKTKAGPDKVYKYYTVISRRLIECDAYISMGDDLVGFLTRLSTSLASTDVEYSTCGLAPVVLNGTPRRYTRV